MTYADEHLLATRITTDVINLRSRGCSRGHPETERADWWARLRDLLPAEADTQTFLLIDANAKTGRSDGRTVFDFDDEENPNTESFRTTLEQLSLCLPSSSMAHTGEHETWHHPGGESASRIDYVGVPQALASCCTHSCVMQDFDLATAHNDHSAVGLELKWTIVTTARQRTNIPHKMVPREAIKDTQLSAFLEQNYTCSWTQDIESQVDELNSVIKQALRTKKTSRATPKKSFITPEIWESRRAKLRWRRELYGTTRSVMIER